MFMVPSKVDLSPIAGTSTIEEVDVAENSHMVIEWYGNSAHVNNFVLRFAGRLKAKN